MRARKKYDRHTGCSGTGPLRHSQSWRRVAVAVASSSSSDTQIEGLGTTLEEIQANARKEGEVNLVNWAGYVEPAWVERLRAADGLQGQLEGCRQLGRDGHSDQDGRLRRRLSVG